MHEQKNHNSFYEGKGRREKFWAPGQKNCVGSYSSEKSMNCPYASDKP